MYGQGTTKASAKETLMIKNDDVISEILSVDFDICNQDIKISYNKVIVKADIQIRILYLTENR